MKKTVFIFFWLCLILTPTMLNAACGGSSPNLVAASANYSDVNDCVTASDYGDTITIPACAAGDCVWDTQITITKDIKIVGAGSSSTYLTVGFTDNSTVEAFFKFVPNDIARDNLDTDGTHVFEVSGLHFYKEAAQRLVNKFGVWIYNTNTPVVKRIKIHNNSYTNIHRATQVYGYVHGVFYSNSLVNSNGSYPQGVGLAGWTNDVRHPGSDESWYIEDNTFAFPDTTGTISGATNDGGSQVVRYNTFASGTGGIYVEAHSNQLGYIKGGFFTEMYGNNFSANASQGIDMRGGQDFIFYNVANDNNFSLREEFYDGASGTLPDNWCATSDYSTGSCVGACPQICTDDCFCWKVNRSYFFNNRRTATGSIQPFTIDYDSYNNAFVTNNDPPELVENREFFNQPDSFDGTVGVGCGTLANRPATCTTGVGYWATTQSCSDLTGMVGANPTTPISGTLYKCTATNTWTAYYTPYAYPHPLRGLTTAGMQFRSPQAGDGSMQRATGGTGSITY